MDKFERVLGFSHIFLFREKRDANVAKARDSSSYYPSAKADGKAAEKTIKPQKVKGDLLANNKKIPKG